MNGFENTTDKEINSSNDDLMLLHALDKSCLILDVWNGIALLWYYIIMLVVYDVQNCDTLTF